MIQPTTKTPAVKWKRVWSVKLGIGDSEPASSDSPSFSPTVSRASDTSAPTVSLMRVLYIGRIDTVPTTSHTAIRPRYIKSYISVTPSLQTAPPTWPPLESSQQEPHPLQHLERIILPMSPVKIMKPPTICQAGTIVSQTFLKKSSVISSGACSGSQSFLIWTPPTMIMAREATERTNPWKT